MRLSTLEEKVVSRLSLLVMPGLPLAAAICVALAVVARVRNVPLPPELLLIIFLLLFAMSAVVAHVLSRRYRDLTAEKITLIEQVRTVQDQNHDLYTQLEVLAAMREVSRIIGDDVDFRRIMEQVFQILDQLLKPQEILVIVEDETTGAFAPRALRRGGQVLFDDIDPREADDELIRKVRETGQMQKHVEGGIATFASPLFLDRKLAGVAKFVLPLDCPPGQAHRRIASLELIISDIARHIALAIMTPRLHNRAITDGLTGLYSRRHFENQLREHTNLARRYNKPLSLIMLDIDNFKLVNNQYGHLSGDAVLAEVGAVLKANVRDCDSVYRYGGEELAVILPETNATHSQAIAERLRRTIQEKAFIAGRNSIRVTISLGIAELDHTSRAYDDLVSRADQALFDAKARGRNSTSIWTQEGPKAVT